MQAYAAFTQLPRDGASGQGGAGTGGAAPDLPPLDAQSAKQEAQRIFGLARQVLEEHNQWLHKKQQDEAARRERGELLRVAASDGQATQVTLNFQLPGGAKATHTLETNATGFDIYSKAYELVSRKEVPFTITVSGPTSGTGAQISKQVDEAAFGTSLSSLSMQPGCSYNVVIAQGR
ncbi:unnamed protein product [Effrenium voratum]|uniref:Uncharacterized protein n=1 Tax=Effrenium voratum TaxID=2562239 RepID=A0AA36IX62_9DINO|nr:unnamed protein product [Effrenium voratum]